MNKMSITPKRKRISVWFLSKEILEMKNSTREIKNELASREKRANQMDERVSDIKDTNLEIMQTEKET